MWMTETTHLMVLMLMTEAFADISSQADATAKIVAFHIKFSKCSLVLRTPPIFVDIFS
jgi:hypothetical protein